MKKTVLLLRICAIALCIVFFWIRTTAFVQSVPFFIQSNGYVHLIGALSELIFGLSFCGLLISRITKNAKLGVCAVTIAVSSRLLSSIIFILVNQFNYGLPIMHIMNVVLQGTALITWIMLLLFERYKSNGFLRAVFLSSNAFLITYLGVNIVAPTQSTAIIHIINLFIYVYFIVAHFVERKHETTHR